MPIDLIESPTPAIEEVASNEHVINVPQASIASDVQQVEDLDPQPLTTDLDQLHLDDENVSSNAYRYRYFDLFH